MNREANNSLLAAGVGRAAALCAVLAMALAPPLHAAASPALTLDRLLATPSLSGVSPSAPAWSPDSRRFAFTWNDAGMPHRSLWIADRDGGGLRELAGGAEASPSVREFAWLPGGKTIVSLRGGDLWSTEVESGKDTALLEIGGAASTLSVSPDGRYASYLRDGDLWLADLDRRRATAATRIGIPGLSALPIGRYSRPEREIGPGIWGGPTYAWSADGRFIAVHYVDRRQMRKVPFPHYLGEETSPNEVRRGYPGDANEFRTVGLLSVADLELRLLEFADPTATQVLDFSWSPDGRLLVDRAADTMEHRWLHVVAPGSGDVREIWHSYRVSRGYTLFASAWHADGRRVLFVSDIADRYGLYALDPQADAGPRLLSDAGYDILGPPDVVAGAAAIFYPGNGSGPYERHVYRLSPDRGAPQRVTDRPGDNRGFPSPDGSRLAILHSDDRTPTELYVGAAGGGDARRVTTSPHPGFADYDWADVRYVSFDSLVDDYTLHARILLPADLDPDRRYPVLFGPMYSNTVRNRWDRRFGELQQLLVQQGYIVVQVDMRGSTGYGRGFREEFLLDFAGDDIEDLASAVRFMKTLPYVDPERFGIWGSSYGGTLTVFALLKKPGLFRAGVAGAAAVDPRFFGTDDVAIVRRPQTHPEVFERVAERYAANLEDHLLIIHGMQDQVVPFKTTVELAEALMRNGKDFDFAFAPAATHRWTGEPHYARYLLGKLIAHFDRYLMPAATCCRDE